MGADAQFADQHIQRALQRGGFSGATRARSIPPPARTTACTDDEDAATTLTGSTIANRHSDDAPRTGSTGNRVGGGAGTAECFEPVACADGINSSANASASSAALTSSPLRQQSRQIARRRSRIRCPRATR